MNRIYRSLLVFPLAAALLLCSCSTNLGPETLPSTTPTTVETEPEPTETVETTFPEATEPSSTPVVTDRVVVDRQLQKAIMGMEHKAGLIRVMDDKCNSADLAIALKGNTKIIATTIQKFPYIVDSVSGLKKKNFAVIGKFKACKNTEKCGFSAATRS